MSRPPSPLDAEARQRLDEAIASVPAVHDYSPVLWPLVFVTGKLDAESLHLAGNLARTTIKTIIFDKILLPAR